MAPVREPSLPSVPYEPLPPQNVVVLVPYPRRRGHRLLIRCLYGAAALLFLALAIFFLYPSDPYVQVARVRLNHIQVDSSPNLTLDLSFSLTIRIRNKDFFSLYYNSLLVSVGYRGRELGIVTSEGEKIRARGSSYVNATLDLDGLEVVHDAVYLIRDLAKGVIPFDTDTQVNGKLGLFFVSIPIEILCGARRRTGQRSPRGAKPTITEGRKQSTGTPSKQPIRDPGADSHRWTRNHLHIHGHIMEQQGNRTRRSGPQRKHRIHQWLARRDHDEQPPASRSLSIIEGHQASHREQLEQNQAPLRRKNPDPGNQIKYRHTLGDPMPSGRSPSSPGDF